MKNLKQKYGLVIVVLVLLISVMAPCFAASESSSYKITLEVLDSGGGDSTSSGYKVHGKTREREIDNPISSSFKMFAGFIAGAYFKIFDPNPPAPINDLAARGGANAGEIALNWTAVGDDGNLGTATSYIVKFSITPITTQSEFNAAITYVQNWTPLAAGSIENKTLTSLNPGDFLYFAIVAVDEAGKQGDLGNSPGAVVKVPPEAPVRLVAPPTHSPIPFNPDLPAAKLTIEYRLTKSATIQILIFNVAGELVWKKTYPADTEGGQEGLNRVAWGGISDVYGRVANGVYVYHLVVRENGEVRSLGKGKLIVHR